MNRTHFAISLLALLLALGGCKTNKTPVGPEYVTQAGQVVYVVNEGNFNKPNSSVTMYVPDSLTVFQNVFFAVNQKDLGDTGNDIVVNDTIAVIVVNNSQRLEVVSAATMRSLGTVTIPGAKSPYKAALYSGTKGYVTNLKDNSVTVFNPSTYAVLIDRIPVGANPQGIAIAGDKVYVCNRGSEYEAGVDSTVSVINALTDAVVRTIVVGKAPAQIAVDAQGNLIVRCEGVSSYPDPSKESAGSLVKIDPATDAVTATLPLPLATYDHPSKMALSATGAAYVKVKSGIIRVATQGLTIDDPSFIPLSSFGINGMAFDDLAGRLYVADAGDYVSAGMVTIYDGSGKTVGSFQAGITPGAIAFKLRPH